MDLGRLEEEDRLAMAVPVEVHQELTEEDKHLLATVAHASWDSLVDVAKHGGPSDREVLMAVDELDRRRGSAVPRDQL